MKEMRCKDITLGRVLQYTTGQETSPQRYGRASYAAKSDCAGVNWSGSWQDGTQTGCHRKRVCIADVSRSLCFWSFLVKSLECRIWAAMPKTFCATCCHSGYKGKDEEVSLVCFPADAEQRQRCKLKSLDGESIIEVRHDREGMTSFNANKTPKPKPITLGPPAIKRRKFVVGRTFTYICPYRPSLEYRRVLVSGCYLRRRKCHVKAQV